MISSLRGKLSSKSLEGITIEIGTESSAIGYRVSISKYSFEKLPAAGHSVFLHIYTAVREDDISLYGFTDDEEQKLFQKLITVNGIGPKLALTILSGMNPRDLSTAILKGDLVKLTSISGIGKKTAERMVLDLKEKMIALIADTPHESIAAAAAPQLFEEALSALQNLGYYRAQAEKILGQINITDDMTIETIIRLALRSLK